MWYNSSGQGWGSKALGRNTSIVDAEVTPSSPIKPSAGRIIRIVNNMDQSVQVIQPDFTIFKMHAMNYIMNRNFACFLWSCGFFGVLCVHLVRALSLRVDEVSLFRRFNFPFIFSMLLCLIAAIPIQIRFKIIFCVHFVVSI